MSTTNSLSINTLTASTIVSFSTITASTIRTTGPSIAIGQNVSNPNRFVEIRSDIANSSYLDFHSSDSAVPDFSTRIQSLGGATSGTGALNMTASTMGLMASSGVGIGTTNPATTLHVYQSLGYTSFYNTYGTATAMPAQLVLDAISHRLYLGSYYTGGVGENAVIQSSSYYSSTDHGGTLLLNPNGGSVGINTTGPNALFHIYDAAASSPSIPFMALSPNLPANGAQFLYFGKANSNNNTAQIGWFNIADGSALNYAVLQIYGKANIMTWQASSGNVGIGTTAPVTALDINGISRAIGGFGTNSGSVPGLTTTGTIIHRFRGGAALLSIIGQNNLIYLGFVQWIGNVTSPGVTAIISGGYTATIDGTPDITIKTTAGTSNASWNITYLACPGYAGPGTFTPGF